jgi:hypothetical protein
MATEVTSLQELSDAWQRYQALGYAVEFPKTPGCCETMPSSFRWKDENGNWHEVRLKEGR